MQKCLGFFFAWRFVVLDAKAASVWAPASAGMTSSGAILANVYKRARSSVIVRLVIWVPQGALKKTHAEMREVFSSQGLLMSAIQRAQYRPRGSPG
jgi:hypothetical protein